MSFATLPHLIHAHAETIGSVYTHILADESLTSYITHADEESLHAAFLQPRKLYIEAIGTRVPLTLRRIFNQPRFAFALSLSSRAFYNTPLAQLITAHAIVRMPSLKAHQTRLETCLQEAIMNAVIHGNLEIESDFSNKFGFERFCQQVDAKMENPLLYTRHIGIVFQEREEGVTLTLTDEGAGHDRIEHITTPLTQLHGRGLGILHSLSDRLRFLDFGRTVEMTFAA